MNSVTSPDLEPANFLEAAYWLDCLTAIGDRIKQGCPILGMPMPNGKPLAECTGAEVGAYGNWLQRIGTGQATLESYGPKLFD